jgi:hypothetical protein
MFRSDQLCTHGNNAGGFYDAFQVLDGKVGDPDTANLLQIVNSARVGEIVPHL